MVVLATDPVIPPGLMVQLPDGKPPNVTLPVAVEQVGCVVELIVGADGVVLTVAVTSNRAELSQPLIVWLAK